MRHFSWKNILFFLFCFFFKDNYFSTRNFAKSKIILVPSRKVKLGSITNGVKSILTRIKNNKNAKHIAIGTVSLTTIPTAHYITKKNNENTSEYSNFINQEIQEKINSPDILPPESSINDIKELEIEDLNSSAFMYKDEKQSVKDSNLLSSKNENYSFLNEIKSEENNSDTPGKNENETPYEENSIDEIMKMKELNSYRTSSTTTAGYQTPKKSFKSDYSTNGYTKFHTDKVKDKNTLTGYEKSMTGIGDYNCSIEEMDINNNFNKSQFLSPKKTKTKISQFGDEDKDNFMFQGDLLQNQLDDDIKEKDLQFDISGISLISNNQKISDSLSKNNHNVSKKSSFNQVISSDDSKYGDTSESQPQNRFYSNQQDSMAQPIPMIITKNKNELNDISEESDYENDSFSNSSIMQNSYDDINYPMKVNDSKIKVIGEKYKEIDQKKRSKSLSNIIVSANDFIVNDENNNKENNINFEDDKIISPSISFSQNYSKSTDKKEQSFNISNSNNTIPIVASSSPSNSMISSSKDNQQIENSFVKHYYKKQNDQLTSFINTKTNQYKIKLLLLYKKYERSLNDILKENKASPYLENHPKKFSSRINELITNIIEKSMIEEKNILSPLPNFKYINELIDIIYEEGMIHDLSGTLLKKERKNIKEFVTGFLSIYYQYYNNVLINTSIDNDIFNIDKELDASDILNTKNKNIFQNINMRENNHNLFGITGELISFALVNINNKEIPNYIQNAYLKHFLHFMQKSLDFSDMLKNIKAHINKIKLEKQEVSGVELEQETILIRKKLEDAALLGIKEPINSVYNKFHNLNISTYNINHSYHRLLYSEDRYKQNMYINDNVLKTIYTLTLKRTCLDIIDNFYTNINKYADHPISENNLEEMFDKNFKQITISIENLSNSYSILLASYENNKHLLKEKNPFISETVLEAKYYEILKGTYSEIILDIQHDIDAYLKNPINSNVLEEKFNKILKKINLQEIIPRTSKQNNPRRFLSENNSQQNNVDEENLSTLNKVKQVFSLGIKNISKTMKKYI